MPGYEGVGVLAWLRLDLSSCQVTVGLRTLVRLRGGWSSCLVMRGLEFLPGYVGVGVTVGLDRELA